MSNLPSTLAKALGVVARHSEPIVLADAAARKNPESYSSPHPLPGITRVRQADAPDAVHLLSAKDVTQDSSWLTGSADAEGLAASIAAAQAAGDNAQTAHDTYAAKKGSWSGIPVVGNPNASAEFVLIEDQGAFPTGLDIGDAVAGSVPKLFVSEHSDTFTLDCTSQGTIVTLQTDEACILFPINGLWVPFVFHAGQRMQFDTLAVNSVSSEQIVGRENSMAPPDAPKFPFGLCDSDPAHQCFLPLWAGTIMVRVAAPASAGAAGTTGQFAFDSDFYYVCVAPNTWKRTALSTW